MSHVLFLFAAAVTAAPVQAQQSITAFVDVGVVPMDQERVLTGQTVVVRGSRIAEIGPVSQVKVPPKAVRVDGRGKFLMPSLADMHMHLQASMLPDELLKAYDESTAGERMLLLYLANGVTTVRTMAGLPWHLVLRERAKQGELLPRIYASSPQVLNGGGEVGVVAPRIYPGVPLDTIKAIVAAQKAAGYDFIKLWSAEFTAEQFDTFVAATQRVGIGFAGHPPETRTPNGLELMFRGRAMSVEHLYGKLPKAENGDTSLDAMAAALAGAYKRAGVWACPNQVLMEASPGTSARGRRALEYSHKVTKALSDSGVGMLLGTDGPTWKALAPWLSRDFRFPPPGAEVPLELEALVKAGLSPYQALETGTRNVAAFLGALDSTGTVTVGKRGDLILLPGNPLEDVSHTATPAGVMLGGRWLSRTELRSRLATAGIPAEWYP